MTRRLRQFALGGVCGYCIQDGVFDVVTGRPFGLFAFTVGLFGFVALLLPGADS